MSNNEKTETCGSCGLVDPRVEASGIWYCPNALCMGCGGGWFRQTLDSYSECRDGTHTVDEHEWLMKGSVHNKERNIHRFNFYRTPAKEDMEQDNVNHPAHYQGKGMESIQVIEAFDLGFNLGNAVKYILRCEKKGKKIEDLNKAVFYLQREIENEKGL